YLLTLSDDALPELLPLLDICDPEVLEALGPGLACRIDYASREYRARSWQSAHSAHQTAWDRLGQLGSSLSRWTVYKHPYDGDFVYVGEERALCATLLQSFVLEPGLTSEYR
ncbi:MAG: hypothetical protein AAB427_13305, partial [Chloroflexota bacterium]